VTTDNEPAGNVSLRLIPLAIGTLAIGSDAFVIAGILPKVAAGLGVSLTAAGQLVTIFAVVYALGAPVLASTVSRFSAKSVLLTALVIFCVANLAAALAPDYGFLVACRVVAALGAGLYTPTAAAAAAMSVRPERRGRALAIVFAGLNVANVVGVPIGTLIGNHYSWRWTFGFVAIIGVVALASVAVLLKELPPLPTAPLRTRIALLGKPGILLVLLSVAAGTVSGYAFYTYIAPELHVMAGISQSQMPLLLLINGIFIVVGGQLGGWLVDHVGVPALFLASFAVLAVIMFLTPVFAKGYGTAVVVIIIFALSSSAPYVPAQHRLAAEAGAAAPMAFALNSSALYLGITLAGALGGWVLSASSARAVPVLSGAAAVVAIVLFLLSYLASRTPVQSPQTSPDSVSTGKTTS
jgi:MFS transporter, DHA1 family, inner membrane transport protein